MGSLKEALKPPLEILLEIGLNVAGKRGIDYYVANVIEALSEMDSRNRYTIFTYFFRDYARKRALLPCPAGENFELLVRRFPESVATALEKDWRIPLIQKVLLMGRRIHIYHALAGVKLPRLKGPRTIVTFFDLAVEAYPERGVPEPGKKISDPYTYDVALRADCLLATGDYTKKDLIRYYGVPEEKIAVIPTGVNLKVFHPVADAAELERVRERYGLPEKYLMTIGPYVPRRRVNAETVLEAFAAAKREGSGEGVKLVLVGSRIPYVEELLGLAARLGLGSDVVAPGYVALEDLAAVYGMALAVVHPTSVEGFGFGMEVLACGTPLVTSNLPGVVEAVSDAALTVPPGDVGSLKEVLRRILTRPDLRLELREKGLARAPRFSYRMVAERMLELYERLASDGRERHS